MKNMLKKLCLIDIYYLKILTKFMIYACRIIEENIAIECYSFSQQYKNQTLTEVKKCVTICNLNTFSESILLIL